MSAAATAELVIAPSTSSPVARDRPAGAWLLALDDAALVDRDGVHHEVLSPGGAASARTSAQAHAERALHALEQHDFEQHDFEQHPPGDRRSALTVAAVSKIDVYLAALSFLRSAAMVREALARVEPRSALWAAADPPLARAVLEAQGARGVRVVASAARPRGPAETALAALKRSGMDWSLRSLLSLADARRVNRHARGEVDTVGVFDVRNDGMIANVALVLRELARQGTPTLGLYMDRRVGERVRAGGAAERLATLTAFGRTGDLRAASARTRGVGRALAELWREAAEEPLGRALAAFTLRRFHAGYVWQTLVDAAAAERLLDTLRPRALVVASDAHRYARLLVLAARERGVATNVLQHGALAGRDLYVPLVADRMLAWGPWCRSWFVEQGTPSERVHAVGFVRAPARQPLRGPIPEDARLLFAAQPIPDGVTRELLDSVLVALERDERLRLVVRPHPGESRRAALAALLAAWPGGARGRVELSPPGRSLADDLAAADAVAVSQSTVGIDALAAGVPTLMLSHPSIHEVIPFRAFGAVIDAADGPALAEGLRALRDPACVAALGHGATAFLDAYVGETGAASLSAAAALLRRAEPAVAETP